MNALPMKVGPRQGHSTVATSDAATQILVLVVDDHEDTRDLLRYVFETHGYQVSEATDGEEAVCLAESSRPDVIVIDSTLRRVDGFEATRRIRNLPTVCNVPIVFLSGHAQPTARDQAMASGANDYLVKPVCIDTLEMSIDRQLEEAGRIERKSWAPANAGDRKS
jgi:two-component system cell cycle response regulator DivK